jgi:transposase
MLRLIKQSIEDKEALLDTIDEHLKANAFEVDIKLLQSIPGVGKEVAVSIIAEVGNDMEVFPNEQHLASWAGMSPGNNESAGKKK